MLPSRIMKVRATSSALSCSDAFKNDPKSVMTLTIQPFPTAPAISPSSFENRPAIFISSTCLATSCSRKASSAAAPHAAMGPRGTCHLNSRNFAPRPNRAGSPAASASAGSGSSGMGSSKFWPLSAKKQAPWAAWTAQSGPTRASSSAMESTGIHSPPPPTDGPQEPSPVPNNARTMPLESIVIGMSSADSPSHRSRAPALSGNRPAAR
mmetsp:Transcript_27885/g.54838  ORF Transcript_27885/g.54838 Transcript_27885/m.54838 type:complete len:209 (-) Transcript_27885:940-1566(-)